MQKKLFILALAVLVFVVGGVLVWQKKQGIQTPGVKKIEEEQSESTFTEKYPQHVEAIQGTDEVWYNIPEYGVRMRLNKQFAENLIYSFVHEKNNNLNEEWDAVYFSTKSLTAIDKGCSPEEGSPLGVITKTKGNSTEFAKTEEFYSSRLKDIIQIGEYYYIWTGPQATCWDSKNDDAIQKVRGAEIYKAIQDGVKTIQFIPSK